jgi:hypothetical protein
MLLEEATVRTSSPAQAPSSVRMPASARPIEATEIHTRILRLALGIEDARHYWEHVDPSVPAAARATTAFEQRWFGAKSLERVRYLLASFQVRYDAFPDALAALCRWRTMDAASREVICHWHLQLSDPIYRRFSDELLNLRRGLPGAKVDRDAVLRWVKAEYPDKWSESTCVQFASKLLSAALEAGLVSKRDPRALLYPKVPDTALAYLLYLLRGTQIGGSLASNPYLRSVGIDEDLLGARARTLPGVTVHRMQHLVDFQWTHPDLLSWAREALS